MAIATTLLLVGAISGVIADKLWDRISRHLALVRPAGRLWGWLQPGAPVQLVISTGLSDDSEYSKMVYPTEARAAAEIERYLASTLHKAVRQRLSDGLGESLTDDLVVLGGAVANDIARRVVAMPTIPFHFEGHAIVHDHTGERWEATVEGADGHAVVSTDYCLVVRAENPFNPDRGIMLVAGSRSYGTLAGARILLDGRARHTLAHLGNIGERYGAVVGASVHNGEPGEPRILKCWPLD